MSCFTSYSQRLRAGLAILALMVLTAGLMVAKVRGAPVQIHEDFSRDPGWMFYNLRQPASSWPTRRQDFGWSDATFPGGARPGMIGGWIERSTTPATYSLPIRERTLNDRLCASGVV